MAYGENRGVVGVPRFQEFINRPGGTLHDAERGGPVAMHGGTNNLLQGIFASGDVVTELGRRQTCGRTVIPAMGSHFVAGSVDVTDKSRTLDGQFADNKESGEAFGVGESAEEFLRGGISTAAVFGDLWFRARHPCCRFDAVVFFDIEGKDGGVWHVGVGPRIWGRMVLTSTVLMK